VPGDGGSVVDGNDELAGYGVDGPTTLSFVRPGDRAITTAAMTPSSSTAPAPPRAA
jgi:hypothetical protein